MGISAGRDAGPAWLAAGAADVLSTSRIVLDDRPRPLPFCSWHRPHCWSRCSAATATTIIAASRSSAAPSREIAGAARLSSRIRILHTSVETRGRCSLLDQPLLFRLIAPLASARQPLLLDHARRTATMVLTTIIGFVVFRSGATCDLGAAGALRDLACQRGDKLRKALPAASSSPRSSSDLARGRGESRIP